MLFFSVKDKDSDNHYCDSYFTKPFKHETAGFYQKIKHVPEFIYNKESKVNLESLIRNERPDIAHLHIFYGRLTSSILPVLKKYNIPVVMSVHEYRMLCPAYVMRDNEGNICEKCADGNYFHCITGKCIKSNLLYSSVSALECFIRDNFISYEDHIDKFIMVSQFIMDKHIQHKPSLAHKCEQLYNLIDLNNYSPNFSHKGYYLYFGRLSREKGIMTLLKAWRHFPDLQLKIVGGGELENDIMKFINDNQLSNIELIGYLKGGALFDAVKNSKFTLVPSEWYENNPMNVIESFALGKPVIGARIGGIPELIKEDYNGFLFESGDEDSLITSIKKAENISQEIYFLLGENAYAFAEDNFNAQIYYKKLIKIYENLTNNNNN